jgi:hypothetical protein
MADTGVMSQLKLPLLLEPAVVGPLILSDCNQVAATALATWPATDPRGDEARVVWPPPGPNAWGLWPPTGQKSR